MKSLLFLSIFLFYCLSLRAQDNILIKKGTIIYCKEDRKPFLEVLKDIEINAVVFKVDNFKSLRKWKNWKLEDRYLNSPDNCTAWRRDKNKTIPSGYWSKKIFVDLQKIVRDYNKNKNLKNK